jgi:hypothetical protein
MDDDAGAASVVPALSYKPGWRFKIAGPNGGSLCIYATTVDSQNQTRNRTTQHQFVIPDLTGREFVAWVRDRLTDCERHETCEFLTVDGFAPFMPNHQDEGSPYEPVDRWEN